MYYVLLLKRKKEATEKAQSAFLLNSVKGH